MLLPFSSVFSLDDVDLLDEFDDPGDVGEVSDLPNPLNLAEAVEEAILVAAEDLGSRGRRGRGGKLSPGDGEIGGGVMLERVPHPDESDERMMELSAALCLFSFSTWRASAGLSGAVEFTFF